MYSGEIQAIIDANNGVIKSRELLLSIIDRKENPQLKRIRYNPANNTYEITDDEGTLMKFEVSIDRDDNER